MHPLVQKTKVQRYSFRERGIQKPRSAPGACGRRIFLLSKRNKIPTLKICALPKALSGSQIDDLMEQLRPKGVGTKGVTRQGDPLRRGDNVAGAVLVSSRERFFVQPPGFQLEPPGRLDKKRRPPIGLHRGPCRLCCKPM